MLPCDTHILGIGGGVGAAGLNGELDADRIGARAGKGMRKAGGFCFRDSFPISKIPLPGEYGIIGGGMRGVLKEDGRLIAKLVGYDFKSPGGAFDSQRHKVSSVLASKNITRQNEPYVFFPGFEMA